MRKAERGTIPSALTPESMVSTANAIAERVVPLITTKAARWPMKRTTAW